MNGSLCLCLLLIVTGASADCHLSAAEVSQTNRIVAIRADSQIYPLRLSVVRAHTTLDLICNRNGDALDVVHTTCQDNGSLLPALPISGCSNPIKATVEAVADNSCPYTMYRVGYKLNAQEFLELYRSCYDVTTATAHFVIYLAYPNSLSVSRSDQAFTTDRVISAAVAATFQAKEIYARFEALLGPGQTYISSPRELVFDRGHLAPSADFGFDQYMRQSFKYINVVAQFGRINRSNWKTIENWVRRELASGQISALQVCTAGLGVLQLADRSGHLKEVYLGAQRSNPIPKWLYKIVSDGVGTHLAFLTYNNIHATQKPTPNCRQVACPASLRFSATKEAGYSFCCDPNDFINRNLPNLAAVC